jgi:carbon-monoxide dehydrogenase large subunit
MADQVIQVELLNQRVAPAPLETRGVLATYDGTTASLTVWLTTQDPFKARQELATVLKTPEARIRVIAPDIGGAFGQKGSLYPEEVVVAYACTQLGRPVKWIETRIENFVASGHGRGQLQVVKAALKNDGKIIGMEVKIIADSGAYSTWGSVHLPEITIEMAQGCYDIPALRGDLFCVFTNKVPQDAYRGAGRPEASFLIERVMNVLASRLKLDPVKIRLTNFIKKDKFPFTNLTGYEYDSGDYETALKKALTISGSESLRRMQAEGRQKGKFIGIGLASYVEICGYAPSMPQTAAVTVTKGGEVIVTSGTSPHGQGHTTPFAQIVADELGIGLDKIGIKFGDTASLPWATVTAGSRSAALGGSAILLATRKIKRKMAEIAASALKADWEEIQFRNGKIFSKEDSSHSINFAEVAKIAYDPENLPEGMESTLYEYAAFAPKGYVFPFGTHLALVEVDPETGSLMVQKYFAVDDCGTVLNPLVVEGQVQGGIAQGSGQALTEGIVYDEDGQLLTSTLADYLMPSSETLPNIEWARTQTPTFANPLGVKGIGEAGTIAATPTLVNAVEDALSPFGVTIELMPMTPDYLKSLIDESREKQTKSK